ncbi:unnamed protein product [Spirodela intermedia]|uniref:Ubiquitin receptor RAD23 n=1 Tax=Spirodela intermedia TaxID=51605 RepID=A0A7I8LJ98_SPIIN|nr:unnamed protein product [Spirodela intermedia]
MKLTVKTLKGSHFEVRVHPSNSIMAVKKSIEEVQGKDSYPWGQQLLIHNGKVLKDESTLEENNVREDSFLVVMLSKSKTSGTAGVSSSQSSTIAPASRATPAEAPSQDPVPAIDYSQAASNLVAGSNLEQTAQQLVDMGGGNWDRETVLQALRAAYNNPERAVEYLYSGVPPSAEVAVPVARIPSNQASTLAAPNTGAAVGPATGLPNSSPLNMFPQGTPSSAGGIGSGVLDFLRNNEQFQTLRSMVQSNPQILQPVLQELSKQNPQLLRLIQEHHAEFLQLISEPSEDGAEEDVFEQPEQETISVTPAEQEAIGRLEAMGFDRALVVEAFLACDRNEELAANYLLEHAVDDD